MNLGNVMDGLGAALAAITGLRVLDFPPDSISVPAAVVSFPDTIIYDSTMARGSDETTIKVHVLVGKVSDRSARDALCPYLDGTGASSIKAAIETDVTLGGAAQTARVTDATISTMMVGGVEYLAGTFSIDLLA